MLSFSDFLADNAVIIILVLLGIILGVIGYLKRNVLSKYLPHDDEEQTPEEILQDELDNILVTEKYQPVQKKTKKSILDDEDDDFDYENQAKKDEQTNNDFQMGDTIGFSLNSYDNNEEEK